MENQTLRLRISDNYTDELAQGTTEVMNFEVPDFQNGLCRLEVPVGYNSQDEFRAAYLLIGTINEHRLNFDFDAAEAVLYCEFDTKHLKPLAFNELTITNMGIDLELPAAYIDLYVAQADESIEVVVLDIDNVMDWQGIQEQAKLLLEADNIQDNIDFLKGIAGGTVQPEIVEISNTETRVFEVPQLVIDREGALEIIDSPDIADPSIITEPDPDPVITPPAADALQFWRHHIPAVLIKDERMLAQYKQKYWMSTHPDAEAFNPQLLVNGRIQRLPQSQFEEHGIIYEEGSAFKKYGMNSLVIGADFSKVQDDKGIYRLQTGPYYAQTAFSDFERPDNNRNRSKLYERAAGFESGETAVGYTLVERFSVYIPEDYPLELIGAVGPGMDNPVSVQIKQRRSANMNPRAELNGAGNIPYHMYLQKDQIWVHSQILGDKVYNAARSRMEPQALTVKKGSYHNFLVIGQVDYTPNGRLVICACHDDGELEIVYDESGDFFGRMDIDIADRWEMEEDHFGSESKGQYPSTRYTGGRLQQIKQMGISRLAIEHNPTEVFQYVNGEYTIEEIITDTQKNWVVLKG